MVVIATTTLPGFSCPDWVPDWICYAIVQNSTVLTFAFIASLLLATSYRRVAR